MNYSLEQKVGQMILCGFRGTSREEVGDLAETLKKGVLGGVIFFDKDSETNEKRNILGPEQVSELIEYLQQITQIPLFVGIDQEGGTVARLNSANGFEDFPSAKEVARNGLNFAKSNYRRLSKLLVAVGFNLNFAPVVDLCLNPNNKVVVQKDRCFSDDFKEVSTYATEFINASKEFNVLPVVKHFPGHGSSESDSHLSWVDLTTTWKESELEPYKILARQKNLHFGVMAGHLFNKNFDPNFPASLSFIWLEEVLRKSIGFSGLIFTDDLQMKAISEHFTLEESIELSINAGANVLLFANQVNFDPKLPDKVLSIILELISKGKISLQRINHSFEKIMTTKQNYMVMFNKMQVQ
ncbi:MAG: glycoside hydrolase family 3 protein [Ignavibacteria bacterium]|nr:glycoside hydrolase family 3 protein [Ignavibacteria bacterium]